ncbi:unnamed protein product [Calicophoron daubneyi]|uniref:Nose resistant-to-fluoxetine protein N-terminal domain-containing protein n=1 Tax=Calicophoron daubneyi TaxID=300641 RepID=A0AAV2TEV1_CALDB
MHFRPLVGLLCVLVFTRAFLVVNGQIFMFEDYIHRIRQVSRLSNDIITNHTKWLAGINLPELILSGTRTSLASEKCEEDLWMIAKAMLREESWALNWLDACGKPPAGINEGALIWLGSYEQCLKSTIYATVSVGRYCNLAFPMQLPFASPMPFNLYYGVCVPDSCNKLDLVRLVNNALQNFSIKASETASVCHLKSEEMERDSWFWIAIVLCSVLGLMLVIGSIVEVWLYVKWANEHTSAIVTAATKVEEPEEGRTEEGEIQATERGQEMTIRNGGMTTTSERSVMKYVQYRSHYVIRHPTLVVPCAYSLPFNAWKLWSAKGARVVWPDGVVREHPLTCLDGIRFLSMAWVIFGHFIILTMYTTNNVLSFANKVLNRWTFQVLLNATYSVDSFFFMSGLLSVYLTLNSYRKTQGWGQKMKFWTVYVVHRFVRLTPLYMFVLITYTGLFTHLYDGPLYPQDDVTAQTKFCKDNWYITYLNNLIKPTEMCIGWTWYLANDFQFSVVIAPIFITLMAWNRPSGLVFGISLILSATATYIGLNYVHKFGYLTMDNTAMAVVYGAPYARWGTYAIGMILGWILIDHPTLPLRRTWRNIVLVPVIGLCISSALCLSVVYGPFEEEKESFSHVNILTASFYNGLSRPAFILGVAIIVYLCATQWAEPYRIVLGWSGFRTVARLTYGAYMIHMIIMFFCLMGSKSAVISDEVVWVTGFIAHLVMAYLGAFVLAMVTESPVMAVEKFLRNRT